MCAWSRFTRRLTLSLLVVMGAHTGTAQAQAQSAAPAAASTSVPAVADADRLASARRFPEAAEAYAVALGSQPDLAVARRAVGVFWRAGRFVDAYTWARRLEAAFPRDERVLFNLGVTCGYLLETACVRDVFTRALAINPAYVYGHGELAFLAQARGDAEAAVRHMRDGFAVAPTDEFAVSGLVQMLIPAGGAEEALALTRTALAANPSARAYGGRSMLTLHAWALSVTGRTAEARAAATEVLGRLAARAQQGETSYELFRERAAVRLLVGQRDAAIADLEEAARRGWRLYGSVALVDPMFADVRSDPAVEALLTTLRLSVDDARRALGLSALPK